MRCDAGWLQFQEFDDGVRQEEQDTLLGNPDTERNNVSQESLFLLPAPIIKEYLPQIIDKLDLPHDTNPVPGEPIVVLP